MLTPSLSPPRPYAEARGSGWGRRSHAGGCPQPAPHLTGRRLAVRKSLGGRGKSRAVASVCTKGTFC